MQLLVHAGDLPEILARARRVSTVHLAGAAGEIIPPVAVRAGSAESLAAEKRTGREFENVRVPRCSVCRVSQPSRVHWVTENFRDSAIMSNHSYRIPFVGIHPDIARLIQGDAIGSLKNGVRHEDVVET